MRAEHKFFNFDKKISICELFKIEEKQKDLVEVKIEKKSDKDIKAI